MSANRSIARVGAIVVGVLLLAVAFGANAFAQEPFTPIVTDTTVHNFSDGAQIENAFARLTRYENGVTTAISTNSLVEGEVYTLWWVIFNSPENCSNGACDLDDIFVVEDGVISRDEAGNRVMNMEGIETANISVQHAAGGYAVDGTFNTSASLGEGNVAGILFGPGLQDAETAEVHLVVRTHGPKVDELYADQLSSFGGGCEPMDAAPCDDVQYAIFMPEN